MSVLFLWFMSVENPRHFVYRCRPGARYARRPLKFGLTRRAVYFSTWTCHFGADFVVAFKRQNIAHLRPQRTHALDCHSIAYIWQSHGSL